MILAATVTDTTVFTVAAIAVIAGALGVVLARNPVHSALMLVLTLFGVAVLFIAQGAHFLAAVQVIVYAGAIVVLFLFVIMLIGVDKHENLATEPLKLQRPLAICLGLATLAEILLLANAQWVTGAHSVAGRAGGGGSNVSKLARELFSQYLLPFELTSLLLIVAVVGAVTLSRRARGGVSESDSGDGNPSETSAEEPRV